MRLPNSQQASDRDNGMIEAWGKISVTVIDGRHGQISFFGRAKALADTSGFVFNNSTTLGLGLSYLIKPGKNSSLAFSLRKDYEHRWKNGLRRQGLRILVDYFFLRYRVAPAGVRVFGLQPKARIFKLYGNLTYPDTLAPGDDNMVISGGAEYGPNLILPNSKLYLTPYTSLNLSWDSDGNPWNNKAQPGVGIKARWPVTGGDIHLGLRYRADWRWKSDTFRHGPSLFIGWYTSF